MTEDGVQLPNEEFPIKVYDEKFIVQPMILKQIIDDVFVGTVEIGEFWRVSYNELIQNAVLKAYNKNPNQYDDESLTVFLFWYDNILFDFGRYQPIVNAEHEPIIFIEYFHYLDSSKYQEVINEKIFDRTVKICVIKTTSPILTNIVNFAKKRQEKNAQQNLGSVNT